MLRAGGRNGRGVHRAAALAVEQHALVLPGDAADLVLAADAAGKAAAREAAAVEADDAADTVHAGELADDVTVFDRAAVDARETAEVFARALRQDAALDRQPVDARFRSDLPEEAEARARARDRKAADRVAVSDEFAGKVGLAFKSRAGEIDIRHQQEAHVARIALAGAGMDEFDELARAVNADFLFRRFRRGLRLFVPALARGGGRGRERDEQQQREQARKQFFQRMSFHVSSSPPRLKRKRVFSTAPSSSTSSCGSTVSTSTTEQKAPRPTHRPMWLT